MDKSYSIYAIGNPLMDFVVYGEHELIKELGAKPGTMNLLSIEQMHELLTKIPEYKQVPGGSSCNRNSCL